MSKKSESVAYYILRIAQLWSLLLTGLLTSILVFVVILIAANNTYFQQANVHFMNVQGVNDVNSRTMSVLGGMVLGVSLISLALTLTSLAQKRARQFDKARMVSALVVVAFCLVTAVTIQLMVRSFISHYLVNVQ